VAPPTTFVLLHSPLVGPATWRWVAEELRGHHHAVSVPSMLGFETAGPPYWPAYVDRALAACRAVEGRLVVVAHSGAGLLLPAIVARLGGRVEGIVYAEAALPAAGGETPPAPAGLLERLQALTDGGILPPWSAWFGDAVMESLVPDPSRRAAITAELPRLPLDYFSHPVPVPAGWDQPRTPTYLWFSEAYAGDAAAAGERGWPVVRLPGGHLHMAVDPMGVATALREA
jgi:pimeloyl-ACP methyl ester carboxylesterase